MPLPIPIHIPIGVHRVATVEGLVWKTETCGLCGERFAYLVHLSAEGSDHDLLFLDGSGSQARAEAQARENFVHKSQNTITPVPCPNCGNYQAAMAERMREEAWINRDQMIGAGLIGLAIVLFMFDTPNLWLRSLVGWFVEMPAAWLFPAPLAVLGTGFLVYGLIHSVRYDPNAGSAAARIALGRQLALRGEALQELLAAKPAESTSLGNADRQNGEASPSDQD